MKAEERDKLLHAPPPGIPRAIANPSMATPMGLPPGKPPLQFPMVHPSTTSQNEGDRYITQQLLQNCLQGDLYQCPRCDFSTPSPEDMINHLADEINNSMNALSQVFQQRKPAHGSAPNPTP